MDDLEKKLIQLNKNLNVLKLREARFAGNAPLELLNQIDDHEQAIKLLYQARRGEISEDELLDNLHSLTLAIDRGQVINITGDLIINIGDTQLAIPRRLHQAVLGSILLGIIFLVGVQMLDAYQAAPSTPIPRMTGDFNVAVARFHALDGQGQIVESAEARDLAESVYSTLADELESLSGQLHNTGINLDLEVWTPNQTGDILGNSREERAKSAEKRASDINADLIVYGQLVSGKIGTNFIPEFYLSEQKLRDAEELVGQYEFGTTIKGSDLITRNVVTRSELRDRLLGRTRALAQFVIGLSLYTLNRFDAATTYFLASEATEGWDEEDGKEVLYHFLGNTALRLNHLQVAEGYYQHALQLEPEYARSQLGIAEINFHRSRADCQPDTVDAEGVHLAITGYQQALMAAVQPALSDIHTKAAFAVGRAYLCLSQAEIENHWSKAEQQFLAVIVDYEEGNPRVRELAADAYAHLGLIYLPEVDEVDTENKYQRAADAFVNALELTHYPERQATYNLWLGWIYAHSGDCTAAAAALAQADKSLTELANNRDNPDPVYHEFRLQVGQAVSTCNSVSHADPPD